MAGISPLLGLGLATSGVAQGLTQGKQAGTQQYRSEVEFKENRETALQRKKQGDLMLQQMEFQNQRMTDPTRIGQEDDMLRMQLEQTQIQTQQMGAQLFQQSTYKALDSYLDDNNPRHLDAWIQQARKNPYAPENLKNTLKVERLQPNAVQEHKQLLARAGIQEAELDALDGEQDGRIDWDLVNKRFVKVLEQNPETGEVEETIRDVYTLGAATGYADYATDRNLDRMQKLAQIHGGGAAQRTPSDVIKAREVGEARLRVQAGQELPGDREMIAAFERSLQGSSPASFSEADRLAAAQERVRAGEGTPEDEAFIQIMSFRTGGTKLAQNREADKARDEFDAQFADSPFEEIRNNREAERLINRIEVSAGLDADSRKEVRAAQRSISQFNRAVDLQADTVGPVASHFERLRKYVSNTRGGRQASAAWNAGINDLLTNLFGATVPDGEMQRFDQAYGKNTQQIGWILEGLKSMGETYRADLESLYLLNDPRVVKYRTGHAFEDLENALYGIEARIQYFDAKSQGKSHWEAARIAQEAVPSISWETISREGDLEGRKRTTDRPMLQPEVPGAGAPRTSTTGTSTGTTPAPALSDDDIAKALGF